MNLGDSIRYVDFHTHHGVGSSDTVAIVNVLSGDDVPTSFPENTLFSAGIHPWFVTGKTASMLKSELILTMAHPHVIAIGEAGFDMLRGPSEEIQTDLFSFQASLAEEMQKPLIIHCVRAWDILMRERKRLTPTVPWIIHGFRGKPLLAASLSDEGFLFSLGRSGVTAEVLKNIDMGRLLLETDDTGEDIAEVYRYFCEVTGMTLEQVTLMIKDNVNRYIG